MVYDETTLHITGLNLAQDAGRASRRMRVDHDTLDYDGDYRTIRLVKHDLVLEKTADPPPPLAQIGTLTVCCRSGAKHSLML